MKRKRYAITGIALSGITAIASFVVVFGPNTKGGLLFASLITAFASIYIAVVFYILYREADADDPAKRIERIEREAKLRYVGFLKALGDLPGEASSWDELSETTRDFYRRSAERDA